MPFEDILHLFGTRRLYNLVSVIESCHLSEVADSQAYDIVFFGFAAFRHIKLSVKTGILDRKTVFDCAFLAESLLNVRRHREELAFSWPIQETIRELPVHPVVKTD
jgi:hypothetical protein